MLTILQEPGEISLSRNQMLLSFRALDGSSQPYSSSNPAPEDYKILLDIFFESVYLSGSFASLVSLDLYIDAASEAVVDLSSILHAALEEALPELLIPGFDVTVPMKADIVRRFYCSYRESYEGASEDWTDTANRLVLCGGISQALFAAGDFFGALDSLNSLLSWYPLTKTVSGDQPEWIGWFNYTGAAQSVTLRIEEFSADSNVPTVRTLEAALSVEANKVALLPAGPAQLGIADTTLKYVVRVVNELDSAEFLSQKRSYYVDRLTYRSLRYVVYLNSFCLPETLRCVGVFEKELEVERKQRQAVLAGGYASTTPEISQYDQSFSNRFTYRSGYLSKGEVEALQELLILGKVYEVNAAGVLPLNILDKKYRVLNTGEILSSIQFTATRAQGLLNYSLDYQLLQPGSPDIPITACEITIEGTYFNEAAAIAGGLSADQVFQINKAGGADLGLPTGILFKVNPSASFSDDQTASQAGINDDDCYALSRNNLYGLPRHILKKRNPAAAYPNDQAALNNGLGPTQFYALSADNSYGLPEGILKKIFLIL